MHFITICNLLHILQINKQIKHLYPLFSLNNMNWPENVFNSILVHEYLSAEYKIWNCNGNVLNSSAPVALLKHPTD